MSYDRRADARAYFLAALDNGVHPLVPMTTSRAQAVRDQWRDHIANGTSTRPLNTEQRRLLDAWRNTREARRG